MSLGLGLRVQAPAFLTEPRGGPVGLRLPAALSLGVGPGSAGRSVKAVCGDDQTFSPQAVHTQPGDAGPAAPGGLYVVPLPRLALLPMSAWWSES